MIEEAGPALKFKQSSRTFPDAQTYTNDLEALRQQRYKEENAQPKGPPANNDAVLQQELANARAAVANGAPRAGVIARAKQRGFDLEANGF